MFHENVNLLFLLQTNYFWVFYELLKIKNYQGLQQMNVDG